MPFLRRTVDVSRLVNPTSYAGTSTGLYHEYLFLPTEGLGNTGETRLIAPTLPGNDSGSLSGASSNNFLFNIGMAGVELTWSGCVQPLTTSQQPPDVTVGGTVLDATTGAFPAGIAGATYIRDIKWETAATRYTSAISTVSVPAYTSYFATNQGGFSGTNHRDALFDFWADQGATRGTVSDIRLGWPAWNIAGNRKVDLLVAGAPYRLFNGNVTKPDFREVAGQADFFDYRAGFRVGKTL